MKHPYKVAYDASAGTAYFQWRGLEPSEVLTRTQRMSASFQIDTSSDGLLVGIELRAFDETTLYIAARLAQKLGCAFPRDLTGIIETNTVTERSDEEELSRRNARIAPN